MEHGVPTEGGIETVRDGIGGEIGQLESGLRDLLPSDGKQVLRLITSVNGEAVSSQKAGVGNAGSTTEVEDAGGKFQPGP